MKLDTIMGHCDNPAYEMNFNIRIKEEALKPTAEIIGVAHLIGNPDLIPLPVVMTVIHDIIADIANKTGQSFDTIIKDMKEVQSMYPTNYEEKINYELR